MLKLENSIRGLSFSRVAFDLTIQGNEMVCAKTLYNYLHKGVLGIKAIDLPLVVRNSQRKSISRKHKRELGKSIVFLDLNIETCEEFGH